MRAWGAHESIRAPAGPCTLENPWRGPQGLQAPAELLRRPGENSLRILEADYQRYVILHMQSSRTGRPPQVLAPTVRWPVPGEVRGWPGHPQSSPWHRGRVPLVQVPHTCPSFPSPPPTRPQTSVHRIVPELKSSFLDRFDKACKSHGLGPEKIIRLSNQGRRQGLWAPAAWASKALKGTGVGWEPRACGRDLRQSLSESLTVFSDPCYVKVEASQPRPSGA